MVTAFLSELRCRPERMDKREIIKILMPENRRPKVAHPQQAVSRPSLVKEQKVRAILLSFKLANDRDVSNEPPNKV